MRPMWTVVDGVHHKENVRISKIVIIPTIASVVFAQKTLVEVIILVCNIKNVSLYVIASTCNDGIMNQDESDVDCGGSCSRSKQQCANGLRCNSELDCISGVCASNICQGKYGYLRVKY